MGRFKSSFALKLTEECGDFKSSPGLLINVSAPVSISVPISVSMSPSLLPVRLSGPVSVRSCQLFSQSVPFLSSRQASTSQAASQASDVPPVSPANRPVQTVMKLAPQTLTSWPGQACPMPEIRSLTTESRQNSRQFSGPAEEISPHDNPAAGGGTFSPCSRCFPGLLIFRCFSCVTPSSWFLGIPSVFVRVRPGSFGVSRDLYAGFEPVFGPVCSGVRAGVSDSRTVLQSVFRSRCYDVGLTTGERAR